MSQHPYQQHPQAPQQYGGNIPPQGPPAKSNALWWVLIGIAAVALVVLGFFVVRSLNAPTTDPTPGTDVSTTPVDTPSPQTTCCGPSPSESVDPSPSNDPTTPSRDWGSVVPPNVDNLADWADAQDFPTAVGAFALVDVEPNPMSSIAWNAHYREGEGVGSKPITAAFLTGTDRWARLVDGTLDPEIRGMAVCGIPAEPTFEGQMHCLVAANDGVVEVFGFDHQVTMDELAQVAQALHDGLR